MMEDSTLKFPGLSHIFLDINPLNSPTASKFVFFLVLLTLGILTMPLMWTSPRIQLIHFLASKKWRKTRPIM